MRKSRANPVEFEVSADGCHLVTSHKPTAKGYIKVYTRDFRKSEYYHRTVYRETHGLDRIPEGFEIDHMCRNRRCCNPEHLQLLSNAEHVAKTHSEVYDERRQSVYEYWLEHRPVGRILIEKFGIGKATAQRWTSAWKKQLKGEQL